VCGGGVKVYGDIGFKECWGLGWFVSLVKATEVRKWLHVAKGKFFNDTNRLVCYLIIIMNCIISNTISAVEQKNIMTGFSFISKCTHMICKDGKICIFLGAHGSIIGHITLRFSRYLSSFFSDIFCFLVASISCFLFLKYPSTSASLETTYYVKYK